MTHAQDIYAPLFAVVLPALAVIILAVLAAGQVKPALRRLWAWWDVQCQKAEARLARIDVRPVTRAELDAEALRLHNERYANPQPSVWGQRVTPMDHDAVREPAPRVYTGRVEVVFPDAVKADVVPVDWVHYLYDAALFELDMRRGPTDEEPTGALVLAGAR